MFDIGWTEMALIAVVAVIVIGPKELPKVMREMGYWVSRARNLSRAFLDQLEEMSRQSGIDEVRKEVEAARHLDPARQIEKTIDPEGVISRQTSDLARIGAVHEPPRPTGLPETPPAVAPEVRRGSATATPVETPPAQPEPQPRPVPPPRSGESAS